MPTICCWLTIAILVSGDAMAGELARDLQSADAAVRRQALEKAAADPEQARQAAAQLVPLAADADEELRELAVGALESLESPAPESLPEITRLLATVDGDALYWAATLIGRLGADGTSATPALIAAFRRTGETAAQERIVWALGQLPTQSPEAAELLRETSGSKQARLARLAKEALDR